MYTALIVIIIITAVLLMLVVLAQNPKGGGLSSQFGGSGATQMMGVKKTGDFLEKATWTLAIALLVFTLVANVMVPEQTTEGFSTPNLDNAGTPAPTQTLPLDGASDSENTEGSTEDLNDLLAEPEGDSADTTSSN